MSGYYYYNIGSLYGNDLGAPRISLKYFKAINILKIIEYRKTIWKETFNS